MVAAADRCGTVETRPAPATRTSRPPLEEASLVSDPVQVPPADEHNATLVGNVHPADWRNPVPSGRYHLVVIGAGSAGLITSAIAAGLGAKVALVERHLLGGDCLNVGCVPSKAVIRSARVLGELRRGALHGLHVSDGTRLDFGAMMARMRDVRATISANDSAWRYQHELGVDVYLGNGRFVDNSTLDVDGTRLRFKKAVIATGARASAPPIDGLDATGYLTNETVFTLTEQPRRLAVIGAGPIGCELAQAFQRLGSQVTLLEVAPRILIREDRDAADVVYRALEREGVELLVDCQIQNAEPVADQKLLHYARNGTTEKVVVDEILVGVGRAPNVEDLNLSAVGVAYDARLGVLVDDRLRTTNRRIYAAGDICMAQKFTHAADAAAKIVVQNALFFGRKKLSDLIMPWCTYTDPEVAHVGLYAAEAEQQGIEVDTYTVAMADVDRAVTDGETDGFVKVHVRKGTDRIVGATIVAPHAGEMISEVTLAMVAKNCGLGTIGNVIHPYPTQAEAIKRAAGAYTRSRFSPRLQRLFAAFFRVTR